MTSSFTRDRAQTVAEEIANAVSHGFGAVTILAATPFLVVAAASRGGAIAATSVGIYCATALLLYLSSTLYHALPAGRAKCVFRSLDHSSIFLLIAGTYTPFALGALWGPWGWGLLSAVWALAVIGIAIDAVSWRRARTVAVGLYLCMGWLALAAIGPIVEHVAPVGIALLVGGGVAYTLGLALYACKGVRFAHLGWHLFVLGGTGLHLVAIARYAV